MYQYKHQGHPVRNSLHIKSEGSLEVERQNRTTASKTRNPQLQMNFHPEVFSNNYELGVQNTSADEDKPTDREQNNDGESGGAAKQMKILT